MINSDENLLFTDELRSNAIVLAVETEWSNNEDPLNKLLRYLSRVNENQLLCLVTPFEPAPLMKVISRYGFVSRNEKFGNRVVTWIGANTKTKIPSIQGQVSFGAFESKVMYFAGNTTVLDVSQMKMPEPMLAIFNALEELPSNGALFVEHSKVPVLILPEFGARGFRFDILEAGPGKIYLLLYKSCSISDWEDAS